MTGTLPTTDSRRFRPFWIRGLPPLDLAGIATRTTCWLHFQRVLAHRERPHHSEDIAEFFRCGSHHLAGGMGTPTGVHLD